MSEFNNNLKDFEFIKQNCSTYEIMEAREKNLNVSYLPESNYNIKYIYNLSTIIQEYLSYMHISHKEKEKLHIGILEQLFYHRVDLNYLDFMISDNKLSSNYIDNRETLRRAYLVVLIDNKKIHYIPKWHHITKENYIISANLEILLKTRLTKDVGLIKYAKNQVLESKNIDLNNIDIDNMLINKFDVKRAKRYINK